MQVSSDEGIKVNSCSFSGKVGDIYVGVGSMYGGSLRAYGCIVLYQWDYSGFVIIKATATSGYVTGWYGVWAQDL